MEFRDYVPTMVLHDFVGRIETLGIRYMLTGSMAMIRYTVFRQTADIDIILEFESEDKEKFFAALEPDYYIPRDSANRAIETNRMFKVIHIETAFKIDCILKKTTEFQQDAFERREMTDYYGREIYVISKEDLILSKLFWARGSLSEVQLRDVKNLMRAGFGIDYAEKQVSEMKIADLFYKCGVCQPGKI